MADSLTRHDPLHQQFLTHGRRLSGIIEIRDVEPEEVCNVMAMEIATSDLYDAEYKEFRRVSEMSARRWAQMGMIFDLLSKDEHKAALADIADSGVVIVEGDPAESGAMETIRRLVVRVRSQQPSGASEARRLLRMLEGVLENGTDTTIRVSADGYVSCMQGGTSGPTAMSTSSS